MPDWSKFTDNEIVLIKQKMNNEFDKAMIAVLLCSPIICLVMPYIPGRSGREPMIERMPYWDAVLQMSIFWILALLGVWVWNYFRSKRQFARNRQFLKKEIKTGNILNKTKGIFKSYDNYIETNIDNELGKLEIEKYESPDYSIGDKIEIEYEEHTKAILRIRKV